MKLRCDYFEPVMPSSSGATSDGKIVASLVQISFASSLSVSF
jgi:hypothetical protein